MANIKISRTRQLFRKNSETNSGEVGDNSFVADKNTVEAIMQAAYKYAQNADDKTFLNEINNVKNNILITNNEYVSGYATN